jgi:hypothetical protein
MSKQYLYRVSILNRKNSHPLEAISYYSGESQHDILNSKNYSSNTSENVIWNMIVTPGKQSSLYSHLPEYIKFRTFKRDLLSNARNILWRNVFTREKRDDAQFARLFEVSMPAFLKDDDAIGALTKFAEILAKEGMIADCSVHSRQKSLNSYSLLDRVMGKDKQPKDDLKVEPSLDYIGYMMCTLRDYENGSFVNKNREWNDKKKMELWRAKWLEILAQTIENANVSEEQKKAWEEKMTIYNEYEKIKQNIETQKPQSPKALAM